MLLSDERLPDPDVGARHHVAGLDVPRPGRGGEHEVRVVGDQLGHHLLHPVAALRVRAVVAHHQRHLLGGQRAAHLQVGHDLEVVQLAQQVQRGDPVLGVRAAGQRDGAGRRLVAVGAVDDVGVVEVADAAVAWWSPGRSSLASSTVGRIGSLGTLALLISARAPGIVARERPASSLPFGALHGDVLAPGERRRGQRHAQQRRPSIRARSSAGAAASAAARHGVRLRRLRRARGTAAVLRRTGWSATPARRRPAARRRPRRSWRAAWPV